MGVCILNLFFLFGIAKVIEIVDQIQACFD